MTSTMSYRAKGKQYVMEKKKLSLPELVISVKRDPSIVLLIRVIKTWF